ncbi:hypothetical protein AYI68_g7438 [Smittium mucronatum]|uniref:Uncharacterized protein n=1 Tax=Smittium mucronatum TaxID=133383 RepID=A0A1R0GNP0_9FUNG|nr:hypothetical protein AYI68_g7438 [Smittium mucronatum]
MISNFFVSRNLISVQSVSKNKLFSSKRFIKTTTRSKYGGKNNRNKAAKTLIPEQNVKSESILDNLAKINVPQVESSLLNSSTGVNQNLNPKNSSTAIDQFNHDSKDEKDLKDSEKDKVIGLMAKTAEDRRKIIPPGTPVGSATPGYKFTQVSVKERLRNKYKDTIDKEKNLKRREELFRQIGESYWQGVMGK